MALIHEFAWSASRAAGFRECQRAHYYKYYGGWLGWEKRQPAERQQMYQLNKLTGMAALAGTAVHTQLAQYFHMRPAHTADAKEIAERASDMLRRGYQESATGQWKQSASKFTHLAEHHFQEDCVADRDAVAEYGRRFVERIEQCVDGFFASEGLAWVRDADPSLYLFVEDDKSAFDTFEYEGTKIFGSPDFVIRDEDGHVHLYDWKTGRPSRNDAFQLHVYALYARIKWGVPVEEFSGYDAYLQTGDVVKCEITPESMGEAEQAIRDSIGAMRELHFDADEGMGEREPFLMLGGEAPDPGDLRVCGRCNFREVCGR